MDDDDDLDSRKLVAAAQRTRFILVYGGMLGAFGFLTLAFRDAVAQFVAVTSPISAGTAYDFLPAFGVLAIAISITLTALSYLRTGVLRAKLDASEIRRTEDKAHGTSSSSTFTLELEVESLKKQFASLRSAQHEALSGGTEALLAELRPSLSKELVNELQTRFAADTRDAAALDQVRAIFGNAHQRLRGEIGALANRGNLNLAIGAGVTIAAILVLVWVVFAQKEIKDAAQLASFYIPRLTLVIFIEVFAFFFLKLYRATLGEMRAYQDELTALSLHQVALEAMWPTATATMRSTVAKQIIGGVTKRPTSTASEADTESKVLTELVRSIRTAAGGLPPSKKGGADAKGSAP